MVKKKKKSYPSPGCRGNPFLYRELQGKKDCSGKRVMTDGFTRNSVLLKKLEWCVWLRKAVFLILQCIAKDIRLDSDEEIVDFIPSKRNPVKIDGKTPLIA